MDGPRTLGHGAKIATDQLNGRIGERFERCERLAQLDAKAPEGVKEYSRSRIPLRFAVLEEHFARHEFALDTFSIADAYLTTILNWRGG